MCGRATYKLTWEEIVALYRLTLDQPPVNTRARYNVCPTTTIDTILDQDGKRRLERMRWGLIPSWWSKPLKEMKLATFNARAETVATKPMFRSAFKRNRCPSCQHPLLDHAVRGAAATPSTRLWRFHSISPELQRLS
jgi:putative SOS response-associated peptidase YedK